MGMIEKKCDHCNGVGYVEAGSKLEEKPNGDISATGLDKGECSGTYQVIDQIVAEHSLSADYENELKKVPDPNTLEAVPVELIASKRRGRPPRTEK